MTDINYEQRDYIQIDMQTDIYIQTSMHTDNNGNHAAQATAIACMCMHACIVPTAIFAQSNSSIYPEACISDMAVRFSDMAATRCQPPSPDLQHPTSPETEVWTQMQILMFQMMHTNAFRN